MADAEMQAAPLTKMLVLAGSRIKMWQCINIGQYNMNIYIYELYIHKYMLHMYVYIYIHIHVHTHDLSLLHMVYSMYYIL